MDPFTISLIVAGIGALIGGIGHGVDTVIGINKAHDDGVDAY